MRDIDELLRRELKSTGEAYRPADVAAARERFLGRARRRVYYFGAAALGAVAAIALAFAFLNPDPPTRPDRADVAGPQGVRISEVVDVGADPDGVAIGGGAVWVANAGSHSVSRIDPGSNETTSIELSSDFEPEDVVVSQGLVWVSDAKNGSLQRIDAGTRSLEGGPIVVPGGAGSSMDLAVGGDAVWVTSPSSGLYRIDALTGSIARVPLSSGRPTDVAIGAGFLWVLDPLEQDSLPGRHQRGRCRGQRLSCRVAVGRGFCRPHGRGRLDLGCRRGFA